MPNLRKVILGALPTISAEGVKLKSFRATVLDVYDDEDKDKLKKQFTKEIERICTEGNAKVEDDMLYNPSLAPRSGAAKSQKTHITDRIAAHTKPVQAPRENKKRKLPEPTTTTEEEDDSAEVQQSKKQREAELTKELWKHGEKAWKENLLSYEYLSTNPDKITRLFCGNLNRNITEDKLKSTINDIVFIKWITDKETKEFYGTTYIEMKDPAAAAAAVLMNGTKVMGRPLKIYYCPPRPGSQWSAADGSSAPITQPAPKPIRSVRPKPPGCRKLFCGNLSYNIDDDTIVHFFKECGELSGLRWLTHMDTGAFRGCAFVEFKTTEEADKAIKLNGQEILGRPIRLDWDE